MKEVSIKRQTMVGAFFRMKLRGKNIIPSKGTGKADTVIRFARTVLGIIHNSMVTVDEIKITAIRDAGPYRVRPSAGA